MWVWVWVWVCEYKLVMTTLMYVQPYFVNAVQLYITLPPFLSLSLPPPPHIQGMCHSHSNQETLKDKLKAMKNSYLNSPIPPRLHIDIPQYMAEQVLKKEVGPYVFREAQATVFHHLYAWLLAGLPGDVTWLVTRGDSNRAQ